MADIGATSDYDVIFDEFSKEGDPRSVLFLSEVESMTLSQVPVRQLHEQSPHRQLHPPRLRRHRPRRSRRSD